MSHLLKAKIKAFSIHLFISFVIFLITVSYLVFSLYPSFFFRLSGGMDGFKLMLFVDMVIGPALTLVIFNPKKKRKEKLSDFLIIGMVQLGALAYGFYTVYNQHPRAVLLYERTEGVILPYKVAAEETIPSFPNAMDISGVKVVLSKKEAGQKRFVDPREHIDALKSADEYSRNTIHDSQQKELIVALNRNDKQYNHPFVFRIESVSHAVYVMFDEKLNYIDNFGEMAL